MMNIFYISSIEGSLDNKRISGVQNIFNYRENHSSEIYYTKFLTFPKTVLSKHAPNDFKTLHLRNLYPILRNILV